jgi:DcuC family C4-dicarboxylate transporter
MLGIFIAAVITMGMGYLVLKKYKPQPVILLGGLLLLSCALMMGKSILASKQSLGMGFFDVFKVVEDLLSNRVAGLGLMIMSVAGYVRFMDKIGASKAFVSLGVKPLSFVHSPYLVLALGFLAGQIMKMAITSAAGLGVLLMATMFPLLINLGASRAAAAAVIVTSSSIDLGPAAASSQLVAKNAGIEVMVYFLKYQLPIAIVVLLVVAILHYFTQKWFDKKSGYKSDQSEDVNEFQQADNKNPSPAIYALLPILPLLLIFVFNPVFGSKVKMTLISAILIGMFISMIFEYVRHRNAETVFGSMQSFFDGMGSSFASVVTLVVAAETFSAGLTAIGAIHTIIEETETAGLGSWAMILVMQGVITGATLVTGSGDASFFSFAGLVPVIAERMNINPAHILLPMQFSGTIARAVSPISGVCVAVAGLAMVSPIDIVKRTAIPMTGALLATTITSLLFF